MRKLKTSKGFQISDTRIICPECDGGGLNLNKKTEKCIECDGEGHLSSRALKPKKFTQNIFKRRH